MKESSMEFLQNALMQIEIKSKYDVIELFKLYSAVEIDSYSTIIDSTNEFFEFLRQILPYTNSQQSKCAIESAEKIICFDVSRLSLRTYEKTFAKTVLDLSPTAPNHAHILDVGPGNMPISSLVLGQSAKSVSAMDKEFIFAIESLKNMNVNAMENFFDKNTSVDDYDFVVGRCPCTAIEHIVAKCKKLNKPYFIELCNCALPNRKTYLRDENGNELHTWRNVLPDIDPNVKFYDDYAFNLDASPEQVKSVIDKINESNILPDKYTIKPKKVYINSPSYVCKNFLQSDWTPENKNQEELSSLDWE